MRDTGRKAEWRTDYELKTMEIHYGIVEIAGWIAVFLYVLAYFLLSTNRLSAQSYLFHILNVLGATGLIINAYYFSDQANLVVNVVWFAIGTTVIVRKMLSAGKRSDPE